MSFIFQNKKQNSKVLDKVLHKGINFKSKQNPISGRLAAIPGRVFGAV